MSSAAGTDTTVCLKIQPYRQFFSGELQGRLLDDVLHLADRQRPLLLLLDLLELGVEVGDHLG